MKFSEKFWLPVVFSICLIQLNFLTIDLLFSCRLDHFITIRQYLRTIEEQILYQKNYFQ